MLSEMALNIDEKRYPILNLPDRPKTILDKHVAQIYQVPTKQVNQAVRRNPEKFPSNFYFELTIDEIRTLNEVTICDLGWKGGYLPKVFTWEGCNMLATVLKSDIAIKRAIQIIQVFTQMERKHEKELESISKLRSGDWEIIKSLARELNQIHLEMRELKERIKHLERKPLEKAIEYQDKKPLMNLKEKRSFQIKNEMLISKEEGEILKKIVKEKSKSKKEVFQIWFKFKKHFKITRYLHLPKVNFEEGVKFIRTL